VTNGFGKEPAGSTSASWNSKEICVVCVCLGK
jgi:hypothetical protein